MKSALRTVVLASFFVSPALVQVACQDSFKDCADTSSCPPEGDGDGDLGGNPGDGDGDGDGTGGGGGGAPSACDPECDDSTPHCDETEDPAVCVECLTESDCTGDEQCNEDGECVACLENEHCEEAALPMCEGGACVSGCGGEEDCTRFDEQPVCDEESGECVGCTPETEETQCGAKSCDPATLACGPHDRASRGTCRSCVSDSDCIANHLCVPMEYPTGAAREGGYCLEISGACNNPYTLVLTDRETLSGVSGTGFCGINEDLATCEAVRALEDDWRCDKTSLGDGQCWPAAGTSADAVAVPGALCRTFEGLGGDRCTYPCSGASQCDESPNPGSICGPGTDPDPATPDFCGGQEV